MKQRSLPGFGETGHISGHVSVFEHVETKEHTATLTVSGVIVLRVNGATERDALHALAKVATTMATSVATVCTMGRW